MPEIKDHGHQGIVREDLSLLGREDVKKSSGVAFKSNWSKVKSL